MRKEVDAKLEQLLKDAHSNIETALKKGDVRTSMWLVDTVAKRARNRVDPELLQPLIQAVQTIEDIEDIGAKALMLTISGKLTFSQLKELQEALGRHAVLKGIIEISDLRKELQEITREQEGLPELGRDHVPQWGRLIEHEDAKEASEADPEAEPEAKVKPNPEPKAASGGNGKARAKTKAKTNGKAAKANGNGRGG